MAKEHTFKPPKGVGPAGSGMNEHRPNGLKASGELCNISAKKHPKKRGKK